MATALLHPLQPSGLVSILCLIQDSPVPREPAAGHSRRGRAFLVLSIDIEHMDLPRTEGATVVLASMGGFVAGAEGEAWKGSAVVYSGLAR